MYSFLPDELLKEILAPALQVPDESFACITGRSPFSNYNPKTSAYLLVCKDWLRVATPLLYSVVVLRSKAQIQALEAAIKTTPVLGTLIRKLRVESGYCSSLLTILRAAGEDTNKRGDRTGGKRSLTDLCLSLEVYSSDNVAAVCRGFGFVNPKRLIVFDFQQNGSRHLNQKAQQFLNSIQFNLEKWTNLKSVVIPSWSIWGDEQKYNELVDAICKSQSIEVVSVITPRGFTAWLDRLSRHKSITKIIMRDSSPLLRTPLHEKINGTPKLKKLIQWGDNNFRNVVVNPMSMMATVAAISTPKAQKNWLTVFPDAVWTNILFYTFGLEIYEQGDFWKVSQGIGDLYQTNARRRYAFVCRKFYVSAAPLHPTYLRNSPRKPQELVKPLYFRCIIISCESDLNKLLAFLRNKPEISNQIKTLFIVNQGHRVSLALSLSILLADAVNLERVSTAPATWGTTMTHDVFDWHALNVLAESAGPRLMDLCIHLHRPTMAKPVDLFYKFTSLKNLEFSSSAKFSFEPAKVHKDALGMLECVICSSINNTFLSFLSCVNLPNIGEARFPVLDKCEGTITFLRKHGSKLHTLEVGFLPGISVFDICSNLEVFVVPRDKPGFAVAEFFSCTNKHPLHTLHIATNDVAKGAEKEKFKYIGGLDLHNFTSLHEVQIDRCTWPITENEIKKSHWVAWAERLQELYQIEIVNHQGQKWIPRLKAKSDKS